MYKATANRKNIVVGVNAGHGTSGGTSVKTLCHPDGSAKTTGGTTGAGATKAVAVSVVCPLMTVHRRALSHPYGADIKGQAACGRL